MATLLTVRPAPARAGDTRQIVFGFKPRRANSPGRFPKWRGTIAKYFGEIPALTRACERRVLSTCELQDWETFLNQLASARVPKDEQIDRVNREMNRRKYVLDQINWGVPDYWESPGEFLRRNGDCEDYAITKYFSLRRLGFPADMMRVVVLQDRNLNVAHAVLAISEPARVLILDNQISEVVEDTRIKHYHPLYAVSENFWEIFIPA